MKNLAILLLDRLQGHAQYADVRVVHRLDEEITVRNGKPEVVHSGESFGVNLRVLKNGCWGFAAACDMTTNRLDTLVEQALLTAEAAQLVCMEDKAFAPAEACCATYITPYIEDPLLVPVSEKIEMLLRCTSAMLKERSVLQAEGFADSLREKKVFASSSGSLIEQEIIHCGAGIAATAISRGDLQVRSYPSSFRGNFASAGYEFVREMDLEANAPRVASEAAELLRSPVCPSGEKDLIVMPDQLALQIHESIGHATELDRILGYEASFAGTSFVTPEMVGNFRYGADLVNVTCDCITPRGLGTFGFDDEGVPAGSDHLIRDGQLVGVLSSCSTAPLIGKRSNATMRADGWSNFPLIRMTNVNLEPGTWKLEDLIADTDDGLLLETNRSWSIDDKRLNFQFATEVAREIRHGKPGSLYRNAVYTGISPAFWQSCDAICTDRHWQLWGIPNCGKGEPMQVARVGHGCAPARFRGVKVMGTA